MNKIEYDQRFSLFIELVRNMPGDQSQRLSRIKIDMDKIIALAKRHHQIEVHICNGVYNRDKVEGRLAKIEEEIKYLMFYLGDWKRSTQTNHIPIKFGGDPRGATVRLLLPVTKSSNNWGGEDWGIW